jgi:hypothetical protein
MTNVQEIENEEEFDAIVLSAEDKLVAVDFSAEWFMIFLRKSLQP